MHKIDKKTLIDVVLDCINRCQTVAELNACLVLVQDIIWTRLEEDQLAKELRSDISVRTAAILIGK